MEKFQVAGWLKSASNDSIYRIRDACSNVFVCPHQGSAPSILTLFYHIRFSGAVDSAFRHCVGYHRFDPNGLRVNRAKNEVVGCRIKGGGSGAVMYFK